MIALAGPAVRLVDIGEPLPARCVRTERDATGHAWHLEIDLGGGVVLPLGSVADGVLTEICIYWNSARAALGLAHPATETAHDPR